MSFIRVIGLIILFAAGIAILYVGLNYFGVGIPPLFITLFWIVLAAAACLLALYFLSRLWQKLP
jgi:hypothetical protein